MRQKIKSLSLAVGVLATLTMLAFDAKYVKEANNVLRGVMATGGTTAGDTTGGGDGKEGYIVSCIQDSRLQIEEIICTVDVANKLKSELGITKLLGALVSIEFTYKLFGKVTMRRAQCYKYTCDTGGSSPCPTSIVEEDWMEGKCPNNRTSIIST